MNNENILIITVLAAVLFVGIAGFYFMTGSDKITGAQATESIHILQSFGWEWVMALSEGSVSLTGPVGAWNTQNVISGGVIVEPFDSFQGSFYGNEPASLSIAFSNYHPFDPLTQTDNVAIQVTNSVPPLGAGCNEAETYTIAVAPITVIDTAAQGTQVVLDVENSNVQGSTPAGLYSFSIIGTAGVPQPCNP